MMSITAGFISEIKTTEIKATRKKKRRRIPRGRASVKYPQINPAEREITR